MSHFIDQTSYIKFLENEIVRLQRDLMKKNESKLPFIYEESFPAPCPPLHYTIPRKASIIYESDPGITCKDAVLLSWGDSNITLYMDQSLLYSMDAMRELCEKFFFDLCRWKVNSIKKESEK